MSLLCPLVFIPFGAQFEETGLFCRPCLVILKEAHLVLSFCLHLKERDYFDAAVQPLKSGLFWFSALRRFIKKSCYLFGLDPIGVI